MQNQFPFLFLGARFSFRVGLPGWEQLCDVTLEVGGETINAHKVILASVSPYFYAMFNGEYTHIDTTRTQPEMGICRYEFARKTDCGIYLKSCKALVLQVVNE